MSLSLTGDKRLDRALRAFCLASEWAPDSRVERGVRAVLDLCDFDYAVADAVDFSSSQAHDPSPSERSCKRKDT